MKTRLLKPFSSSLMGPVCASVFSQCYSAYARWKELSSKFNYIMLGWQDCFISIFSFSDLSISYPQLVRLCDKTDQFLILHKGNPLSSSERWEFVNFWYLTIILNDILAIIGSLSKIMMETQVSNLNLKKLLVFQLFGQYISAFPAVDDPFG